MSRDNKSPSHPLTQKELQAITTNSRKEAIKLIEKEHKEFIDEIEQRQKILQKIRHQRIKAEKASERTERQEETRLKRKIRADKKALKKAKIPSDLPEDWVEELLD